MPIWLRKFTYSNIVKSYQTENNSKKSKINTKSKIYTPDIDPTYSSKASK